MPKKTAIVITPNMLSEARRVWESIGAECEASCAEMGESLDRLAIAEAILDADYMRTYGGQHKKEAADAFDALCADKSIKLDDVYKALADAMYL